MIRKLLALVAIAGALMTPMASQAGLTVLTTADGWPPLGSKGLEGVQFTTDSAGGVKVAMGAHPYISGVTMPNDGVRTYYGESGLSNPTRANWSFDLVYDISVCNGCKVFLGVDIDPTASVQYVDLDLLAGGAPATRYAESLNMEMAFLNTMLGYDVNPFVTTATDFRLHVRDATGARLASTDIIVAVNVPEPASLALVGVAIAGLAAAGRRRKA
ncbi:PEP-CTERM sorting domain-containing protein [Roseateles sp. DC23W]|uniref:PEP-CTERM sorting domain-containing protein n=1 Tax=Pelomonas dachongensis TaxID=3299029 RepID=A0ABW7EQ07_9BURK